MRRHVFSNDVILTEKLVMNTRLLKLSSLFLVFSSFLYGQVDSAKTERTTINGFTRAGFYGNYKNNDNPFISSAFSDFGLKVETGNGLNYKAFADLRFRYGTEFFEQISSFEIREAYIKFNGRLWDMTAGQKILKWGRADFSNPTSRLTPKNLVFRSTDQEDMDLGNLLLCGRYYPSSRLTFEGVAIPFYRSSILMIKPLSLPSYVKINQIDSLVTRPKMFSYGLKTDLHLSGIDMSISWFDGYNPMPGTELTGFNLDLSGPTPVPNTELSFTPYKIRNIGFDFETSIGDFGLRGEAAYTLPYKSYKEYEYVPSREISWVAGFDWSSGNWRFTGEYSGKVIPGFTASSTASFIGTDIDMAQLTLLIETPGFDLREYVRQEVSSFNRLYNYQNKRSYHSAAFRVETDLLYSILTASVFTLYNITTRELLVMPEFKYKPSDGVTISAGADYYSGRKGSLYDIVDDFMNCIRIGVRVDF
jgi:hypothetical protein